MSTTAEQHAEHLDREQAEGDRLEELAQLAADDFAGWLDAAWPASTGLPLDPPLSPEDEEALPEDPEGVAA